MTTMRGRLNRILRGNVLRVLNYFVGQELGEAEIIAGLEGYGHIISIPSLRAQLLYLEEAGCIEIRKIETPGIGDVWMIRLCKKGTDLLECSIPPDPGIEFASVPKEG